MLIIVKIFNFSILKYSSILLFVNKSIKQIVHENETRSVSFVGW